MAPKRDKLSLFDVEKIRPLFEGLKVADGESIKEDDPKIVSSQDHSEEATQCLCCSYTFTSRENQVLHYKSDWHRYNLKLTLMGMEKHVSEVQFEEIIDDVSSISGSDTDTDSDSSSGDDARLAKAMDSISTELSLRRLSGTTNEKPQPKRSPRIFLMNADQQLLSVYKCILPFSMGEDDDVDRINQIKQTATQNDKVCIILLSAGHFAAAVFEKGNAVVHKTHHRYVMRAKQGTVQSAKDNQNSASTPKSAGAALRRHNEAALGRDIQELLLSWKEHLSSCSHIFLRTPHQHKSVFYDGKMAPFTKKDQRIHGIPFPTHRPTHNELKRVWKELYSVEIYDENDHAESKPKKNHAKIAAKDEVEKGRGTKQANNTVVSEVHFADDVITAIASPRRTKKQKKGERSEQPCSEGTESQLTTNDEELKSHPATSDDPEEKRKNSGIIDELYTVCKIGDMDGLKAIVASVQKCPAKDSNIGPKLLVPHSEMESNTNEPPKYDAAADTSPLQPGPVYANQPVGPNGETLLHVAAKAGHKEIVYYLLAIGADPVIKNRSLAVPYSVSSDKAMRNVFRKFMADYPEKYDYKSALIPAPLTEEMEKKQKQKANDKKKAQRAIKKQKQKVINAEKIKIEKENEEKERFAALPDREKRAIAAERRLAQQISAAGSQNSVTVKRCWLCGESLLGKIPFEYLDYQFCSMKCLKKHKAMETVSK